MFCGLVHGQNVYINCSNVTLKQVVFCCVVWGCSAEDCVNAAAASGGQKPASPVGNLLGFTRPVGLSREKQESLAAPSATFSFVGNRM